jgi:hypothetical protein
MPSEPEEQDELLKDLYQDIQPALTERVERPFMAWHKPRKHYIRLNQWCAEVRKLIKLNGYQEGDVIRYLGFPGEDFLDIRTLQGTCAPANVLVKYLGFDSTAVFSGGELLFHISRHEIFDLGFINKHSRVLKARFEQLADVRSLAYRRAKEFRDFDVVNIDLCDSIAGPPSAQKPYFDALKQLCDLQIAGRTRPWILFLTTRVVRSEFTGETKWNLLDGILRNIREDGGFAARLRELLSLDDKSIQDEMADRVQMAHERLVQVFGLSLGKWLLSMMMSATPKNKVVLRKSYSYRVHLNDPDMLSLAFLFEPIPKAGVDRSGLTSGRREDPPEPREPTLAGELLVGILSIEDVDRMLFDDQDLLHKMVNKCGDLLATARYDKERYREWALRESWLPQSAAQ